MSTRTRVAVMVAFTGLALVLAGCGRSNIPQDVFDPKGPYARRPDHLWNIVFPIAVVVFVVVEAAIVFAVFRFRQRSEGDVPRQVHGNPVLEITLTAIPAVILAGISLPTVATIFDLSHRPPNAMDVTVIGHQYWWEYRYPGQGVVTANEMHVPTGRPVYVTQRSVDVIHSFWPPKLMGKRDVVPGRTNRNILQADKPGTYFGQCAEFCGASHANMRLKVVAQTPDAFQAWLVAQRATPSAPATGTDAAAGKALFAQARPCFGCHSVKGVSQGKVGPDLTHFKSRKTFAGSIFPNTSAEVAKWLRNPPGEKPGSKMPNLKLSEDEIAKLVAYLNTLK